MNFTYSNAGVDIQRTDSLKKEMENIISTEDPRVLNTLGPFASLYDFKFDDISHPVLVLKTEEPGSKQKLAAQYGYLESVCHDMINHLVNDIIVMGATPLAVLDTIVCGNPDEAAIKSIIKGISDACRQNECTLVGGETSVQPGVVDSGTFVLTSSIAGVVDKAKIIDGSQITKGDAVLAVASNGLHTNGYTLVRMIMDKMPQVLDEKIDGETFIDAIMKPHTAYYKATKKLVAEGKIKGMAHITGGGIEGNLKRIIPAPRLSENSVIATRRGGACPARQKTPNELCARIDLSKIKTLPLFKFIKDKGNVSDSEMLSTFNCGVGLVIVASPTLAPTIIESVKQDHDCYIIGEIESRPPDAPEVTLIGELAWL